MVKHSNRRTYVSQLMEYIHNKIGHASNTSNFSSKHHDRKYTLAASSTSCPTIRKSKKHKRIRNMFDESDGWEHHDI